MSRGGCHLGSFFTGTTKARGNLGGVYGGGAASCAAALAAAAAFARAPQVSVFALLNQQASTFVQVKQETTFCCCRSLCSRFCFLFLCCGRVPSWRRESVVPGYPSVVRSCLVLQMSPVPLGLKARRTRLSSNSPPCRPPLSSCVCVHVCVCVCDCMCVCARERQIARRRNRAMENDG